MKQLALILMVFILGVMTGAYYKPTVKEEVNDYNTNYSDWVDYKMKNGKPWE